MMAPTAPEMRIVAAYMPYPEVSTDHTRGPVVPTSLMTIVSLSLRKSSLPSEPPTNPQFLGSSKGSGARRQPALASADVRGPNFGFPASQFRVPCARGWGPVQEACIRRRPMISGGPIRPGLTVMVVVHRHGIAALGLALVVVELGHAIGNDGSTQAGGIHHREAAERVTVLVTLVRALVRALPAAAVLDVAVPPSRGVKAPNVGRRMGRSCDGRERDQDNTDGL